jgi:hypothetical protein
MPLGNLPISEYFAVGEQAHSLWSSFLLIQQSAAHLGETSKVFPRILLMRGYGYLRHSNCNFSACERKVAWPAWRSEAAFPVSPQSWSFRSRMNGGLGLNLSFN